MLIYREGIEVHDVKATGASYRDFTLMANDTFILDFYAEDELDLQVGDYIEAFGERYSIEELPVPNMEKGIYHYNLKLYGTYKELEKVKMFLFDTARDLSQSDFNYTCTPQQLVEMIVNNLNAVQDYGWQVGDVIVADIKTISISNQNCLEVLANAASTWETEWYISGFVINLKKRQVDNGQAFSLGAGLAKVSTEKSTDQKSLNRLYAFGGTKNLPAGYLAARLTMPSGVDFIGDANPGDIIEDIQTFDDIFPRRTGTISSVRVDSNGIYYFSDAALPFNPNDLQVDGLAKHVIFQSGQLIGLDFEVNFHDSSAEFELIQYQESGGQKLPASPLIPAVGDTYIIYNIEMPASYVMDAETELQAAAQAYYDENKSDKLSFNLILDEVYFTANNLSLSPGEMITISHPYIDALKQGFNIRVTQFKRYFNKPNKFDAVKVSDAVYVNPIKSVDNKVTKLEKVLTKAGIINSNYAAKNWRDIAEIATMIDSVQTELLLVGNKQGQFDLHDVVFTPNPNGNTDEIDATAGTLVHRTIPEDNPGTWSLSAASLFLGEETKAFYLYAKCSRTSYSGEFMVSDTSIVYDSDPEYWHFLIGVISSLNGNARSFQTVYGFTEISGNEITTGVIRSSDQKSYFDLVNGIFAGRLQFINLDDTYSDVREMINAKVDAQINGKTLIVGGYINTDFIDAYNIITRVLQTKASGARVEVNGLSNSVIVYDANDNPKIVIAPKAVMSLSEIAQTNTISVTYALREVTQSVAGSTVMATIEELVISDGKTYTLLTPPVYYKITAKASSGYSQSADVTIQIEEINSGNIIQIASYHVSSASKYNEQDNDFLLGEEDTKEGTVPSTSLSGIQSGTYRMKVTVSLSGTGIGNAYAKIDSGAVMEAEAMVTYVEIGTDGMNLINSSTDFVHNSGNEFKVVKGSKSIEVTSDFVKINGVIQ
jgi:hypothetical protein